MLEPMGSIDLAEPHNIDQEHFAKLIEPYRGELRVHCYRMLGSLQDAEDLLQETLMRAWQHMSTYEDTGFLRAWLYKIATNACLDALDKRSRRLLPAAAIPAADPRQPPIPPVFDPIWLDPFPDALLPDLSPDPEARYNIRESVRLAFLVALQMLPPRQRAVLILRDVLDCRAREVAEFLDTTVSAVTSALHRARTTLRKHYRHSQMDEPQRSPGDETTHQLLDRYVRAWEAADVAGLTALLKEDAAFTMPPSPTWFKGRAAISIFLTAAVFAGETQGQWRLRHTRANAQPATGVYRLDPDTRLFSAYVLQVLSVEAGQIAVLTNFKNPGLFPWFDLPLELAS